ncbi:hypothetical protein BKA64DRAFT_636089 [Cadophora sp. MPI-SDFR-AT-0126]|nr:hypothetical protein BKA64DRAFT_636089 [Leotiomycetes sp. MPI-SDFR-AT-0126]
MARNNQQYDNGQIAPLTSTTPAPTIESASFQNMNNIDPALRGANASSSQTPLDPKKRNRDDEEEEVLGRPKVPRKVEPEGKEKAPIENSRKRRGSLLGPEMCSTSDGIVIHSHIIFGNTRTNCREPDDFNQNDSSTYPPPTDTPASENAVVLQASAPSARPICKMKSKLSSMKMMASTFPQTPPAEWQNNVGRKGHQCPSVEYHNGGEGNPVHNQGYCYPQANWNGGQSPYGGGFSDEDGMQQQSYDTAYSSEPSETYDVLGQQQDLDGSSATYSWAEVCSYVLDKEVQIRTEKDDQIFYLRQTAASNLNDQRQIDKEEYLEILGQKDDTLNEIQKDFLELEASIPRKLLEREQATRSVCDAQYETKKQEWSNLVSAKETRIQELESQLSQVSNTPSPQAQVVVQEDHRVANFLEQIASYEAADREKSKQHADLKAKVQKAAEDLKKVLESVRTLRSEKTELESSVNNLTTRNEELTQQLRHSESTAENHKAEKDAAEEKASALEIQIQQTSKIHPDVEKELRESVSRVRELEESVKEVTSLRTQLIQSQEKVNALEIEANKVPITAEKPEQSNEKVSTVNTGVSKHIRRVPRLKALPAVPIVSGTSRSANTEANNMAAPSKVVEPVKPAWLVAIEKDQPRSLICTIKLNEENTDLKDANAKLSNELRSTKKQKTRVEATLSIVTENFQMQGEELSRIQKIKDKLARALMHIGIFLLFALLCIPHLLPNPTMRTASPNIRHSPLRTEPSPLRIEVLTKLHSIPNIEVNDNLQFEDLYPEYRYGPQDEENIAESIRVTDLYHEYLAVMDDKAAQRTLPNLTSPYLQKQSPAQEHAIYEELPIHDEKPTTPPSPIKPPAPKVKSGARLYFEDCFMQFLAFCTLCIVLWIVTEIRLYVQRCKTRYRDMQEVYEAHQKAFRRKVELEPYD